VQEEILDFFHASEYISKAAKASFKRGFEASLWIEKACHRLKNEDGGAGVGFNRIEIFSEKAY